MEGTRRIGDEAESGSRAKGGAREERHVAEAQLLRK